MKNSSDLADLLISFASMVKRVNSLDIPDDLKSELTADLMPAISRLTGAIEADFNPNSIEARLKSLGIDRKKVDGSPLRDDFYRLLEYNHNNPENKHGGKFYLSVNNILRLTPQELDDYIYANEHEWARLGTSIVCLDAHQLITNSRVIPNADGAYYFVMKAL